MCGSDCDCAPCQRSRVGEIVTGADAGLDVRKLNNRVHNLYHALKRAGVNDPAFSAWHAAWDKGRFTMTGPELTQAAEQLAVFMQTLGERAHAGVTRVAGASVGAFEIPREVKQVDDAISSVVDVIAPVLPYGQAIQAAHRMRRGLMYGESAGGQKLLSAQAIARGLRRGDPQARAQVDSLRARASSDAEARKTLSLVTVARRDDSARIESRYQRAAR